MFLFVFSYAKLFSEEFIPFFYNENLFFEVAEKLPPFL